MREIKFRGKRVDNGEWVKGDIIQDLSNNIVCIQISGQNPIMVVPETVGQFTGLTDKNGVDIYEDDIVEFIGGTCNFLHNGIYSYQVYKIGDIMIVQKLLSGFTLAGTNMVGCDIPNRVGKVGNYDFWKHHNSLKVIGNIHDNPEIIKEK